MIKDNLSSYKTVVDAPVNKVWDALTIPEIVKQYFFGTNQKSSYVIGEPITWDGEYQGQKYLDKGVVLEYEPLKKFAYSYLSSWSGKPDKPENYLWVKYDLATIINGTELIVSFSSYSEDGAKHSHENWKGIIDALKKVVNDF